MALTVVQSAIGSNGNSSSTTTRAAVFGANVAVGNTIVAAIKGGAVDTGDGTVTDSLGHTYTLRQRSRVDPDNAFVSIFTAPVTTAGACTATFTGATAVYALGIAEVNASGGGVTSLETGAGGSGSSTTPTSGNLITSVDTIMFGFVFGLSAFDVWSAGTGWTQIQTTVFSSTSASLIYRTGAAGTYAANWTNDTSRAWQVAAIALREGGGSPAGARSMLAFWMGGAAIAPLVAGQSGFNPLLVAP